VWCQDNCVGVQSRGTKGVKVLSAGGERLGDGQVGVFLELTGYGGEEGSEEEEEREEGGHWHAKGGAKEKGKFHERGARRSIAERLPLVEPSAPHSPPPTNPSTGKSPSSTPLPLNKSFAHVSGSMLPNMVREIRTDGAIAKDLKEGTFISRAKTGLIDWRDLYMVIICGLGDVLCGFTNYGQGIHLFRHRGLKELERVRTLRLCMSD